MARSVKLTNHHRQMIRYSIIGDKHNKEQELLDKEFYSFRQDVSKALIPPELEAKTLELPDGWLEIRRSIWVGFGNESARIDLFEGKYPPRVPWKYTRDTPRFAADHPLTHRYIDLQRKQEDLEQAHRAQEREIMVILKSATTSEQLKKVWPEIASIVDKYFEDRDYTTNLPVVQTAQLNEIFALPKEAESTTPDPLAGTPDGLVG